MKVRPKSTNNDSVNFSKTKFMLTVGQELRETNNRVINIEIGIFGSEIKNL